MARTMHVHKPKLDILWRQRKFQDGAYSKKRITFSFLSSFLRLAVSFSSGTYLRRDWKYDVCVTFARFRGDPFEIVCYGSSAHIFATRPYLLKNKVSKSIFSLNKSCSQNLCKIFLYLAVFVIIVHNPFRTFVLFWRSDNKFRHVICRLNWWLKIPIMLSDSLMEDRSAFLPLRW